MNTTFRFLALLLAFGLAAAPVTSNARSIADIPGVPLAGLQVYMPNEAFQKLVHAPLKAYISVRGQVINSQISGARVAHSEGRGVYDQISIQMAEGMQIYTDLVGTRIPPTVIVHIFIFGLPDGSEDAFAFAQNDNLRANLIYSRSIMMRHLGLAKQQPAQKPKKK